MFVHSYMLYYVENSLYYEIYRTPLQLRARYPPSYEELVYNASLLLINSQPLMGQILTLPPNAKYVGGHHIEVPTKPLSKVINKILNRGGTLEQRIFIRQVIRIKHITPICNKLYLL